MIYFDPPFSGNRTKDTPHKEDRSRFENVVWFIDGENSFLSNVVQICKSYHRVLKSTGPLFVHLPWDLAYVIKPELDKIFDRDCLRNEIVWTFRAWSADKSVLQEQHHTILWYTKSKDKDGYAFNKLEMPRAKSTRKRFGEEKIVSGYDDSGNRIPSKTSGHSDSASLNDVWVWDNNESKWLFELDEIDEQKYVSSARITMGISHTAPIKKIKSVKTGKTYPWEKPEKLLERLIAMTTSEGDVVLDLFAGTGTTAIAAKTLKRKCILSEISRITTLDIIKRLSYQELIPGFPLFNHPFLDGENFDGKQFQFWAGYSLGGISDDSFRGRDSESGVDIYIPSKNDPNKFIPGEVKKKLSNDEWLKVEGKSKRLPKKDSDQKNGYAIVSIGITAKIEFEIQKSTYCRYEIHDIKDIQDLSDIPDLRKLFKSA